MAFCRDLPVAFGLAQKRDTVLQLVFERATDPRLKQRQHCGFLRGKLREIVAKLVVLYPELPRLAALAFEMEFELSPFHFDVVVLESSQPVAALAPGITWNSTNIFSVGSSSNSVFPPGNDGVTVHSGRNKDLIDGAYETKAHSAAWPTKLGT